MGTRISSKNLIMSLERRYVEIKFFRIYIYIYLKIREPYNWDLRTFFISMALFLTVWLKIQQLSLSRYVYYLKKLKILILKN